VSHTLKRCTITIPWRALPKVHLLNLVMRMCLIMKNKFYNNSYKDDRFQIDTFRNQIAKESKRGKPTPKSFYWSIVTFTYSP
jgi:hypothetical protein